MTRGHVYTSRRNGVERVYDVARLWRLGAGLERKSIEIDTLNLNKKVWFNGSCPSISEITREFEKVLIADLSYPIILDQSGSIMDGYHRIVKAKLQNDRQIAAIQFEINPEPDSIRWIATPPMENNLLHRLVVKLVLMLHREHDYTRLLLRSKYDREYTLKWSAEMLKLIVSTTDKLKAIPHCLSKSGTQLCEEANIAMLDLLQLEIQWQESPLLSVAQLATVERDNPPQLSMLHSFLNATNEMRLHLSHFANGTIQ